MDGYKHEPMQELACAHCGAKFDEWDWRGGGTEQSLDYVTFECETCGHVTEFWLDPSPSLREGEE